MGLGDFFKRRKQRESAIPAASTEVEPLGSFASAEGQPVVGQQVAGGTPAAWTGGMGAMEGLAALPAMFAGLKELENLGPQIEEAMASGQYTQNPDGSIQFSTSGAGGALQFGSVTIDSDDAQTVDMRGSGLREEIQEIMSSHGVDINSGDGGQSLDASEAMAMQAQILTALAKHGVPGIPRQDPADGS